MTISGLVPIIASWWLIIAAAVALYFWFTTQNRSLAVTRGLMWPVLLVRHLLARQREYQPPAPSSAVGRNGGSAVTSAMLPALQGRRLASSLSVNECERLFRELSGYSQFAATRWLGSPGDEPQLLLMAESAGRPALHLVVWDSPGRREIALVPASTPDQLPPAMIGSWKMQDPSLSSIGSVDSLLVGR